MNRGGGALNSRSRRADGVRAATEPNDDDARGLHGWARGGDVEPPGILPLAPLRPDEVVCRSCRLAVKRRDPEGVALLVCDDCRW